MSDARKMIGSWLWLAAIGAAAAAIWAASALLDVGGARRRAAAAPVPGRATGPSVEDILRANGEDAALVD